MKVFVTGGSGFVGANLIRLLVSEGFTVRALVRPGSLRSHLADLPRERVEWVEGDLASPEGLRHAMEGCRRLYHVAADYRLWVPDPASMYAVNVRATRAILEEARAAGVEKAVYCSSVAVLGTSPDGTPLDESSDPGVDALEGHYRKSKYLGEKEALAVNADGFPVVVVNPSAPVGPWDVKPTPTGRIVLDFQRGRMPAYLDTGLNLVDVRDVCRGHLLAMARGRPGERYILGNVNLTLKQILEILAGVTGRPAPRIRIPHALVLWMAYANEALSRYVTRREPLIPLSAVRHAAHYMFYRSDKAIRELGFTPTPIEVALRDAARWFEKNGYVAGRPKFRAGIAS
ncbi:MAG: NAD-dependent epimerase/dehydratase family protein [Candidatus Tectomicrobia bacterium]|nr:NAD-dependent epimerase/dehydratase family protein [Candidatus Tectomicrobia bacterium]